MGQDEVGGQVRIRPAGPQRHITRFEFYFTGSRESFSQGGNVGLKKFK